MLHKQLFEIYEILDNHDRDVIVTELRKLFAECGCTIESKKAYGQAECEFLRFYFAGMHGKSKGGNVPTLGVIGQLGGIASYPRMLGLVSDGDGALAALTVALRLAQYQAKGLQMPGDVIVTTHICTEASIIEKKPVPFIGLPVNMTEMNGNLVDKQADALISLDTTKGNLLLNRKGIAITSTVKQGYILKVSNNLLNILANITGEWPMVLPICTQDITTYNNGISHINSIMQPAVMTYAPVVGLAITAESTVAGSATGANYCNEIEMAARFCIEVAKLMEEKADLFYNADEYARLVELYGDLSFICKDL